MQLKVSKSSSPPTWLQGKLLEPEAQPPTYSTVLEPVTPVLLDTSRLKQLVAAEAKEKIRMDGYALSHSLGCQLSETSMRDRSTILNIDKNVRMRQESLVVMPEAVKGSLNDCRGGVPSS